MADHHPAPAHAAAPPHSHGAHDDAAHVAKAVRLYLLIGFSLMLLTGLTVALSYIDFGSVKWNIIVGMIVASFKASLVALIFMHLNSERSTIYRLLTFTAIFVSGLFFLTFLHYWDPIMGTLKNHH